MGELTYLIYLILREHNVVSLDIVPDILDFKMTLMGTLHEEKFDMNPLFLRATVACLCLCFWLYVVFFLELSTIESHVYIVLLVLWIVSWTSINWKQIDRFDSSMKFLLLNFYLV